MMIMSNSFSRPLLFRRSFQSWKNHSLEFLRHLLLAHKTDLVTQTLFRTLNKRRVLDPTFIYPFSIVNIENTFQMILGDREQFGVLQRQLWQLYK